jgi:hypothetical protein
MIHRAPSAARLERRIRVGALRHYAGHPEDVSGVHKVLLPFVAERLRLQARLIPDQGLRGFTLPASWAGN